MKTSIILLSLTLSLNVCSGCFDQFKTTEDEPKYEQHYNDNQSQNFGFERVPGDVPDQQKTADTDLMCWAITACNMLSYSGHWADTDICMSNMMQEFTNEPGSTGRALGFYFKEYLNIKWSAPETYEATYGDDETTTLSFIMNNIDNGIPSGLSMGPLGDKEYGHIVFVFGYKVRDNGDITLLVTDGDDNRHTQHMTLTYHKDDDSWEIITRYTKFDIGYAIALTPATL